MRLLLDTHVAIWAVTADRKLSEAAGALLADPDNEVAVSVASLWEIAIKNALDRAPLPITFPEAAAEFDAAGFMRLPIGLSHLQVVETLPHHHRDPFDRLLVATALADTYRLVTSDRALAAYGDHVLLI